MMLALVEFLTPGVLALLPLAALPLIIHLLSRRRWRVVRWAAMTFLLRAMRKQRRRLRLENLLLIALRMAAIAALILACARPVSRSETVTPGDGRGAGVILALDTSYSMTFQEMGATVLGGARDLAQGMAAALRAEDRLVVIRAAASPEVVFDDRVTEDARLRAREIIDMIAAVDAALDVPELLSKIERTGAEIIEGGLPARAVVFTDLQARDWLGAGRRADARVGAALEALARRQVALEVFDLSATDRVNLEVSDLRLDRTLVAVDVPVTVQGTIRNWSAEDASGLSVDLLVDGHQTQGRSLDVPGGARRFVEFRHVFRESGVYALALHMRSDGLAVDNTRYAAVNVRRTVQTLLVDGTNAAQDKERGTFFLEAALRPDETDAMEVLSPFRVETVGAAGFAPTHLHGKDIVVLADVDRVPHAASLREFVGRGGALAIFLGPSVDQDFYNREVFGGEQPLCPLVLDGTAGDPTMRFGVVIEPRALDHPVMQFFVDRDDARLDAAPVWRYMRVRAGDNARVLAVFKNPDSSPAIVEAPRAQGSVVVVATTADTRWSNLPKWPDFVPLVHELLSYMASPGGVERNLYVGWPYRRVYPAAAYAGEVRIRTPGGGVTSTSLRQDRTEGGGDFRLVFDATQNAGIYTVELQRQAAIDPLLRERFPEKDLFAVNLAGGEGDLTPTGAEELKSRYGSWAPRVVRRGETGGGVRAAAAPQRQWWPAVLAAMLCLFAAEALCALVFGRRQR